MIAGLVLFNATWAWATRSVVFFTHPTKVTGKSFEFDTGDPRYDVEPAGKCGQPFLGGTIFGIPDPRIANPKEVCGHGKVYVISEPGGNTGTPPLLITPVTTPIAPDSPVVVADSSKLIREQLPRLDKVEGDNIPGVPELRNVIRGKDVANAVKNTPKRVQN